MYVSLAAAVGTVECCMADNIYFCTLATGCPCRTHLSTGPTAELSSLARGCGAQPGTEQSRAEQS